MYRLFFAAGTGLVTVKDDIIDDILRINYLLFSM